MALQGKSPTPSARPFPFIVPAAESLADIEVGVAVGLNEEGTTRVLPLGLDANTPRAVAEALAAGLEEMAQYLRDGWRGDRGTMH